jgi:orotidine-5'-phosphate decarboxylase
MSTDMQKTDSKIIVALDYADAASAIQFIDQISPTLCRVKIGKELFTAAGPELVKSIVARGYDVFLDLKFHDIPNTVNKAITAAARLGVWMANVHALGGRDMMLAAKQAVDDFDGRAPHLIAVSILTSIDQQGLEQIGIQKTPAQAVMDLTALALQCGLDGMVCSALEVEAIRSQFGTEPLLVTPGIRPEGSDSNDQQRIMTPQQAIAAGSSYLVIGRPITADADPVARLEHINQSLSE